MKDRPGNMKFQCLLLQFGLLFPNGCAAFQTTSAAQGGSSSPKDQTRINNEWAVRLAPGLDPHKFEHRPRMGHDIIKVFLQK
jgi:hypothetical protein